MAMFLSTSIQILVRFFDLNVVGTSDISLLNMSFLTFIGLGITVFTKDYIAIEVYDLISNPRIKAIVQLVSSVAMLIFGAVIIFVFYPFFSYLLESGEKTLELGIPLALPIGSALLGAGFVVLHSIGNIIRTLFHLINKDAKWNKNGGLEV